MGNCLKFFIHIFSKDEIKSQKEYERFIPIDHEFQKEAESLLKKKNILPCALKSDPYGTIIKYSECFEPLQFSQIRCRKEDTSENKIFEIENEYLQKEIDTLDVQTFLDISCFHCDSEFKRKAEKIDGYKKKKTSIVAKYILSSFSIDQLDVRLKSKWEKKIEDIANSYSSTQEKAKELDEIFKVIGYFIPLEIKVGGLFTYIIDDNKLEDSNKINNDFNMNAKYEGTFLFQKKVEKNNNDDTDEKSNKITLKTNGKSTLGKVNDDTNNAKYFLYHSKIKGGNKNKSNLDEWKSSITFENSEIIEYKNFTKIKNILDKDLVNKLSNPLEIIEQKYEGRKKYFIIVQELKNKNSNSRLKGTNSEFNGRCKEEDFPLIYCKKYDAKSDGSFMKTIKLSVCQSFNDIIVGWKINCCWNDGTNGTWTLTEDPLLKKEIKVTFVSQKHRGESFEVFVYLMKIPD